MRRATRLEAAQLAHEARLRKLGVRGRDKSVKINSIPDYSVKETAPLSNRVAENGTKRTVSSYSGNYIKGIATSHKSNLLPITNKEQAKDISQMRRS